MNAKHQANYKAEYKTEIMGIEVVAKRDKGEFARTYNVYVDGHCIGKSGRTECGGWYDAAVRFVDANLAQFAFDHSETLRNTADRLGWLIVERVEGMKIDFINNPDSSDHEAWGVFDVGATPSRGNVVGGLFSTKREAIANYVGLFGAQRARLISIGFHEHGAEAIIKPMWTVARLRELLFASDNAVNRAIIRLAEEKSIPRDERSKIAAVADRIRHLWYNINDLEARRRLAIKHTATLLGIANTV